MTPDQIGSVLLLVLAVAVVAAAIWPRRIPTSPRPRRAPDRPVVRVLRRPYDHERDD